MKRPRCVVWPSRAVPGWDGVDAPTVAFSRTSLVTALTTHHPTDAHAVGYLVTGEKKQPRLNLPSLGALGDGAVLTHTVWLDVDRPDHTPWPDDRTRRRAFMDASVLAPEAAVYTTRAGLRLVWVLATPIPVLTYRSFMDAFMDHLEDEGLEGIDRASAEWNRCFRLPYVMRDGEATDPLIDVRPIERGLTLTWTPPTPPRASDTPLPHPRPSFTTDHPPPATIRADHWAMVAVSKAGQDLVRRIKEGRPLGKKGARNTQMVRAIGIIARNLDQEGTPDRVFWMLRDAIEADTTEGAPTLDDLWDRSQAITAREDVQRQARQEEDAALSRALGLPTSTPNDATPTTDPATPTGGPIVVNYGARYYVMDHVTGGYGGGVSATALPAELRDRQPALPRHKKGGAPVMAPTVMDRWGAVAQHKVAVMGTHLTKYAPQDATLFLKACPMRDTPPKYHARINEWLHLIGGESASKLLDWLATCTDLTRPTAALYLRGPRGCGKSLFGEALSRLWADAPVTFETALDRFNQGALTRCPVVYLGEGLGWLSDGRKAGISAAFRRLVGETNHRIEAKYEGTGTLIGAPRLIIAANNDDALPLGAHHTRDDIEAITQRILYLQVKPEAARYLHDLGGWDVTRHWVDGREFAEHVVWLTQNRQVDTSGRFLVEGEETPYHRALVLKAGINTQVLGALCEAVAPVKGRSLTGGIFVHDDPPTVMVNVTDLHRAWKPLTQEDGPTPTRSALAKAVKDLSDSDASVTVRRHGRAARYWPISPALVMRVAHEVGHPAMEALESALSGEKGPQDRQDAKVVGGPWSKEV